MWDGTGLCIFQKRLERSRFTALWRDDGDIVALTASELALFIEGCELVGHRNALDDYLARHAVGDATFRLHDKRRSRLDDRVDHNRVASRTIHLNRLNAYLQRARSAPLRSPSTLRVTKRGRECNLASR